MKILFIFAHPDKKSFSHAIADTAVNQLKLLGHEVIFHDLQEEAFDPIMPVNEIARDGEYDEVIKQHCNEVTAAEGIIIIHPNWWGQPPAILKGWIDRVLRPGIAYEFVEGDQGEGTPIGLLKARVAIVFNTSNTSKEREDNIFLDPLETIWKNCIFYLCGVKIFYRKMFRVLITSSEEQRTEWLREVESTMQKYFGQ